MAGQSLVTLGESHLLTEIVGGDLGIHPRGKGSQVGLHAVRKAWDPDWNLNSRIPFTEVGAGDGLRVEERAFPPPFMDHSPVVIKRLL